MNFKKFIPDDPRFYYYKIHKERKSYYMISGEHIGKNKIPPNILLNVKEYDGVLTYYEACERYEILVKNIKTSKELIEKVEPAIKKIKTEVEDLKHKYGNEICFTYQDFLNDVPTFFYYTMKKNGEKTYYDYRGFLSPTDKNIYNIFNNKEIKNTKTPKQKIVKFDRIKNFDSEIHPYQDKFIIISKIIILDTFEKYNIKINNNLSVDLKEVSNIQSTINLYSDYSDRNLENAKEAFRLSGNEYYEKLRLFNSIHNNHDYYNRDYSNYYNSRNDSNLKSKNILDIHNIKSKKDFRKWASTNHPDKGGDTKIFQEVNEAVRVQRLE
jgi:hypothetical protein